MSFVIFLIAISIPILILGYIAYKLIESDRRKREKANKKQNQLKKLATRTQKTAAQATSTPPSTPTPTQTATPAETNTNEQTEKKSD